MKRAQRGLAHTSVVVQHQRHERLQNRLGVNAVRLTGSFMGLGEALSSPAAGLAYPRLQTKKKQ
jgi:hypothetical protein